MPTLISEEEFLSWENITMDKYPERAVYYDPKTNRAFLLYYNEDNGQLSTHYAMSEGEGSDGAEIIFNYSAEEAGYFQDIPTIEEFRERADDLSDADDPRKH